MELRQVEQEVNYYFDKIQLLKNEISKVVVGQHDVIDQVIIAFLAGGHALIEGVPGLAKTLLIKTLSDAIEADYHRIQFTPDLMPSDIIGTEVLEEDHISGKKVFIFNKGPVFSNILLADEINRTPPKTQAALLEAMQEKEVTYAGTTYQMKKPFFILATQNPVEQAGTFPLPEAQLDRFLLYININYPTAEEEREILKMTTSTKSNKVEPVISGDEIVKLQSLVREIHISDDLIEFVNEVVRSTRPKTTNIDFVKNGVQWGAGPRAGQAMILTAKARAVTHSRLSVTKEDISEVAYPVLRHRILMNYKAMAEGTVSDDVTKHLLQKIDIPLNGIK
jgi:MoxR-like ATPase